MVQGAAVGPMDGADGADGADGGFETLDALGGGGRPVFRPIGTVPEIARRADGAGGVEADYRSQRWPPRLPNHMWPPAPVVLPALLNWPIAPVGIAPRLADFSPDNASLLVLAQLVQLRDPVNRDRWTLLMNPIDMANDIVAQGGVQVELAELRLLAQFRAGAMAEALAQRNGIIGYFRALLYFSLATHPYTYYLVAAALRIGQFLCVYYKGQFNRPRPIRLDPSILSPIDPPGHSAYPSGHSLQSFLIARCLEQLVPTTVGTALPDGQSPFRLLAERIAKLREVLGVHYPSDTAAGQRVATNTFPLMMACPLIAGTAGPLGGDGVPVNQLRDAANVPLMIAGNPMYSNGWLALARREWEPR